MRIGLDLDFTITEFPEFFSIITEALIDYGHEVHVITYRGEAIRSETIDELDEYDIRYTDLHMIGNNDHRNAPEWKAAIAKKLELDAMFEDSPENLDAMPYGVKRFMVCNPEIHQLDRYIKSMRIVPESA